MTNHEARTYARPRPVRDREITVATMIARALAVGSLTVLVSFALTEDVGAQ